MKTLFFIIRGEELPPEDPMGRADLGPEPLAGLRIRPEAQKESSKHQGGVLHVVSEERFRWVGWSIAAAVLVLALTFMSNRPLGNVLRPPDLEPQLL